MNDSVEVSYEEAVAESGTVKADIINGRMPLAVVYRIRFDEDGDAKPAELAKKYHTTPGKISDIKRGSNFAYVNEEYVPSAADIEAAKGWAAKMEERGDDVGAEDLVEYLDGLEIATPEQEAALAEARKSSRKTTAKEEIAETDEDSEDEESEDEE
jgi:hypothetical protein